MRRDGLTDVAGVRVGQANDARIASGVTAIVFEAPTIASVAILGGAPGGRDTALLAPGMTVEAVDALVLAGGSAFGLDAMGGAQAALRDEGRGFDVGGIKVPIVPGAILFDLLNGGDKAWGAEPVYWHLGYRAALAAGDEIAEGTVGVGFGATTARLKGGLGTASARTSGGYTVGAIVAVNAIGSPTIGAGPHFWAAPYERGHEFGGRGLPATFTPDDLALALKGAVPQNTTIGLVATDAALTKVQTWRLAMMAGGGLSKAIARARRRSMVIRFSPPRLRGWRVRPPRRIRWRSARSRKTASRERWPVRFIMRGRCPSRGRCRVGAIVSPGRAFRAK